MPTKNTKEQNTSTATGNETSHYDHWIALYRGIENGNTTEREENEMGSGN